MIFWVRDPARAQLELQQAEAVTRGVEPVVWGLSEVFWGSNVQGSSLAFMSVLELSWDSYGSAWCYSLPTRPFYMAGMAILGASDFLWGGWLPSEQIYQEGSKNF